MPKPTEHSKAAALRRHSSVNPHPERVQDELFRSNPFFDPRDIVQVKYEMLRRVRQDGLSVTRSAALFGVSRPTWYQARRAYDAGGLPALVPAKPGPRRASKLTAEVVAALRAAPGRPAGAVGCGFGGPGAGAVRPVGASAQRGAGAGPQKKRGITSMA